MPQFLRVGSKSEMPAPGQAKEFTAAGKLICVANVSGTLCAMDNVCRHRGAALGQGTVTAGKVVCPWHGWRWDPRTGAAVESSRLRLTVYRLILQNDDVLVEL